MSKCKSCGAEIIWITTAGGKKMPCDKQKVFYKPDLMKGKLNLVLPNGKVTRGTIDFESNEFGYISHFSTCPSAQLHRKAQKAKEEQMTFGERGEEEKGE